MIEFMTVCKFAGIFFLIAIIIAAFVLLFPISYELDGNIDEKRLNIKVNWLFQLVRFRFGYHEKIEAVLRIAFYKLDFTDKEAIAKKAKKKEAQNRKKKARKAAKARKKAEKARRKWLKQHEKARKKALASGEYGENTEESSSKYKDFEAGADPKQSEAEKSKFEAFKEKFTKVTGTINKVKLILEKLSDFRILDIVWPKIQKFLMRIKPRKLQGEIEFGFDDPSLTGKVVGGLTMVPVFYEADLMFYPDFEAEENYIKGNIYMKGHILLLHVVILAIGLIREKNVRRFIQFLRKNK